MPPLMALRWRRSRGARGLADPDRRGRSAVGGADPGVPAEQWPAGGDRVRWCPRCGAHSQGAAGPGGARPDAAGRGRPVHLPQGAWPVRRADPDAHRAHRRHGRGARPGDGRRRLCVQAGAPACAAGAHPCPVAAQRGRRGAGGEPAAPGVRPAGNRQRDARGLAARRQRRADQRRVRPALAAGGQCRAHPLTRGNLHRPARHRVRRPGPLHRRAHLAHPAEDR